MSAPPDTSGHSYESPAEQAVLTREVVVKPTRLRQRLWSPGTDTRWAIAVFFLVLGVYLLTMGGHTYSVDGETYYAGTRALLNGTTVITPTADIDAVVILVEHKNGGLTTAAPVGALVLFAPFYVVGRVLSLPFSGTAQEELLRLLFFSANSVFTALTAALLVPLCRRLGARVATSVLLAFIFALGTWAWAHAKTDFTEPGTAMMLTTTMLAAVRWWRRPSLSAAALVGFLIGCAALTRSSVLLFIPIFLLAGLAARPMTSLPVRTKEFLAFCAGGLLPGIAFVLNAYLRFGSPLDNGYPPLNYATPFYEGVFGQFLSPGKGIFWYAPITIVALFAVRQAYLAQRRYMLTLGLLLAVHLAVYGRFEIWSGENAYGPRYMVPMLPLFIAVLAPVIDSGRQWTRSAMVAGAVGFIVPGLLGSSMYFNAVYFHTQSETTRNLQLDTLEAGQFYTAINFQPRSSPLMLHVRSLDALLENSIARIQGEPGGITDMPVNFEDRIHWYARAVELDAWWAWWPAKSGPREAYFLLLVPFACLAGGASLARRNVIQARVARTALVV